MPLPLVFPSEFGRQKLPVAVWNNPSVACSVRKCRLGNIEIIYSIGILDKFQNAIEECFLCLCFVTGFGCTGWNYKMLVVEAKSNGAQYNVHALLDAMFVRIYLRYIVGADDNAGLAKLPEVLQVSDVCLEGVTLLNGYRHLVKIEF